MVDHTRAADELPPRRAHSRALCASLTDEAEAIGVRQRLAIETDAEALAIMRDAQGEESRTSMDLEFLAAPHTLWRAVAQGHPLSVGDIVEHGEQSEATATGASEPEQAVQPRGSFRLHRLATRECSDGPSASGHFSDHRLRLSSLMPSQAAPDARAGSSQLIDFSTPG